MADDLQSPTEEALAFEGDDEPTVAEDVGTAAEEAAGDDDAELEAIKQRVKEMEEEAEKLKEMQQQVDQMVKSPKTGAATSPSYPTPEEKAEADARSVYIGNVDYQATASELETHFNGCGAVNRVTIMCDKFTGHPKGFAYIEFTDKDSIPTALALDETLFRGRQIKVSAKRTNVPGMARGRGRFRGGGSPVRYRMVPVYGGDPSGFAGGYAGYGGYMPRGYGRARFRSRRGANWYSPY